MLDSKFTARIYKPGVGCVPQQKAEVPEIAVTKKLDPLNPSGWKNEQGKNIRKQKNDLHRTMKQDLLITLDTIWSKKQVGEFGSLIKSVKNTPRKY